MRWFYLVAGLLMAGTLAADVWVDFIDYRVAANVSLVYIAVAVTGFALLYGIRSNWVANRIGRAFLTKSVVFSVVLWQIVVATWIDVDYPFRQHIRFVIYSFGALAYVHMVVMLWREQQRDRRVVADFLADDGPVV